MTKLDLINKTAWDAKDLRRLCLAVIKHKASPKTHQITVGYQRRGSRVTGRAYLDSYLIRMFVKRPMTEQLVLGDGGQREWKDAPTVFDAQQFARTLEHEIDHNLGLQHKDMLPSSQLDVSYAEGLSVSLAEAKPKTKRDLKLEHYNKNKDMAEKYEAKVRRYTMLVKKYQAKVKRYEHGQ